MVGYKQRALHGGGGEGGGGSVCDGDYLTCLSTVSTMNTVWI